MKLAQRASGLLKALRSKHPSKRRADGLPKDDIPPLTATDEGHATIITEQSLNHSRQSSTPNKIIATARVKQRRINMAHNPIHIHEDVSTNNPQPRRLRRMSAQDTIQQVETVDDSGQEEDYTSDESDSDDEPDESVMEDMRKLEESFEGISAQYRLINRIGEGTFSTVYKAEQLTQGTDDHDVENGSVDDIAHDAPPSKRRKLAGSLESIPKTQGQKYQFVALKKIYVTSSPHRILNELELLHELRHSEYICPLLTALRHHDQVVAVLPYFKHLDFRLYYRQFIINDIRLYFKSLFNGLAVVHKAGILHRDIKPTNFLYDHTKRHGVLVDFGLAERQGTDWQPCLCTEHKDTRKERFLSSFAVHTLEQTADLRSSAYPKNDTRPSRRANRAGTRGFRAPEVLFKCTSQTTKIDMWSAGVIFLTLMAQRFPFFNSADDVDAMIEMASVFGKRKMKAVAALHGQIFESNIETIGEHGFSLEKIIMWASCKEKQGLGAGEQQAVRLLNKLLELDPTKRFSAKEALQHEFFTDPIESEEERAEREAQEAEDKELRRRP